MEPEITLLSVFILAVIVCRIRLGRYEWAGSARMAMSAMLVLTGIAHFVFAKGMALMLPECIPFRRIIIYSTGILELLAAIGLQLPDCRRTTGMLLLLFFILLLPANIYAAFRHVHMETATFDGDGPASLAYRVPLQFVFIAWVYFSVLYTKRKMPC